MKLNIIALVVALALTACAQTSVVQMSKNEVMVTTSAAPVCGTGGSQDVAQQMAAVETLRRGYSRYLVVDAGSSSDVRATQTGPTSSTTTVTETGPNTGTATTTYQGQTTIITGKHRTQLRIVMLNPGDPGYDNAIDAKEVLGPDWEKKVKDGISTC